MITIPSDIPNKQDFPQVKKIDRQIIRAAVLLGLDNQGAFALYHPEYLNGIGKLNDTGKKESGHFWSYGKNREYREAYEKTVEEFIGGDKRKASRNAEIDDTRIDGALKKLLGQAIGLLDSGDNLDPDSVKTIVEVFRKMNLLKDEEETQEKPRRYLPTLCKTECSYRLFVESHIERGDIISECEYCRTRKFAEEQGWKFDPTKNLDLPQNDIANG